MMDDELTFRSDERMTPDEFFEWVQRRPWRDVHHYELIQGRIVMTPPASIGHSQTGARLVHWLRDHVEHNNLGTVYESSAGYNLPSGDVLEPDVSFISRERLAASAPQDKDRFSDIAPDLAIEILSPSTARRDRTEKKAIYAANGVHEYWLVDGKRSQVDVFHLVGDEYDTGTPFTTGLVVSKVLPGLRVTIEALFRD